MYYRPAEWHKNKILWLAWPFDEALWAENLKPAQEEFLALVKALEHQALVVIFSSQKILDASYKLFQSFTHVELKVLAYADIWLRDTLPIALKDEKGQNYGLVFAFNGWGGKYLFEADKDLAERVLAEQNIRGLRSTLVCEGGAIECDGEGTLLTTEQCLLNANRNEGLSKQDIEEELKNFLGVQKIIWLKEGLLNDHTDGHIDTIARFVAPAQVAIMTPQSLDDPNYKILKAIEAKLSAACDAQGRRLELIKLPSPGAIKSADNKIMPASYLNFIFANNILIMPTYESKYDNLALEIMRQHSSMQVVGLSAKAILSGGGAFHCISQEYFL